MKKKNLLKAASASTLVLPNLVYLLANGDVLKEENVVSLTMTAMVILSVVGVGALLHVKANGGIWCAIIGVFILALSNVAKIAGTALLIEGVAVSLDSFIFQPLISREKIKELEADGKSVTYTRSV